MRYFVYFYSAVLVLPWEPNKPLSGSICVHAEQFPTNDEVVDEIVMFCSSKGLDIKHNTVAVTNFVEVSEDDYKSINRDNPKPQVNIKKFSRTVSDIITTVKRGDYKEFIKFYNMLTDKSKIPSESKLFDVSLTESGLEFQYNLVDSPSGYSSGHLSWSDLNLFLSAQGSTKETCIDNYVIQNRNHDIVVPADQHKTEVFINGGLLTAEKDYRVVKGGIKLNNLLDYDTGDVVDIMGYELNGKVWYVVKITKSSPAPRTDSMGRKIEEVTKFKVSDVSDPILFSADQHTQVQLDNVMLCAASDFIIEVDECVVINYAELDYQVGDTVIVERVEINEVISTHNLRIVKPGDKDAIR